MQPGHHVETTTDDRALPPLTLWAYSGRVKQFGEKGTYLSPPFPSAPLFTSIGQLLSTSVVVQNRKFPSRFIQRNNESLVSKKGDTRPRKEEGKRRGGKEREGEGERRPRLIANDQFYSRHESYSSCEDDAKTSRHYYLGGNRTATRACGDPTGDTR